LALSGKIAKVDDDASELFSLGGFSVSGRGLRSSTSQLNPKYTLNTP
jgi:hypothetical protein